MVVKQKPGHVVPGKAVVPDKATVAGDAGVVGVEGRSSEVAAKRALEIAINTVTGKAKITGNARVLDEVVKGDWPNLDKVAKSGSPEVAKHAFLAASLKAGNQPGESTPQKHVKGKR